MPLSGAVKCRPGPRLTRSSDLTEADAQRLCLELMRRFRSPLPGVRIGELRVEGFNAGQIKSCFQRLRVNQLLRVASVVDSEGERFRGQVVGLTRLGIALLDSAFANAPSTTTVEGAAVHTCFLHEKDTFERAVMPLDA
jgi:hypothetical protein